MFLKVKKSAKNNLENIKVFFVPTLTLREKLLSSCRSTVCVGVMASGLLVLPMTLDMNDNGLFISYKAAYADGGDDGGGDFGGDDDGDDFSGDDDDDFSGEDDLDDLDEDDLDEEEIEVEEDDVADDLDDDDGDGTTGTPSPEVTAIDAAIDNATQDEPDLTETEEIEAIANGFQ